MKSEFISAEKSFSAGRLAGGRDKVCGDLAPYCELDRMGCIWEHDEIGVAVAEFRFETGKEFFAAGIPCDDDFYACQLSAIRIQDYYL